MININNYPKINDKIKISITNRALGVDTSFMFKFKY
jgi:hypothetical protein